MPRPLIVVLLVLPLAAALRINVTDSGHDNADCLKGENPCRSLWFVLSQLNDQLSHVIIDVSSDQSFHNASGLNMTWLNNVTITGHNVTVTCTEIGAGLFFTNCTGITLSNMSWKNCAVRHPTTALATWPVSHSQQLVFPDAFSSIFLSNCTDVSVVRNNFSSMYGSGLSLYNVRGKVEIEHSWFSNNSVVGVAKCEDASLKETCSPQSTGLYIEFTYCDQFYHKCFDDITDIDDSFYKINNCTFVHNDNPGAFRNGTDKVPNKIPRDEHWPFGRGGGLGIVIRPYIVRHFNLTIVNSTFAENTAVYGGGMYLEFDAGYPDHNSITIRNCTFSDNTAHLNGGGIELVTDLHYYSPTAYLNNSFHNQLYIDQTHFNRNVATWGGGMNFLTHPTNVSFLDFRLRNSSWLDNKFSNGAGAMGLLCKLDPNDMLIFITTVRFYNCSFCGTGLSLLPKSSFQTISHTVYSMSVPVEFHGNTSFVKNTATALSLAETGVKFSGDVLFMSNAGINGGAIFMSGMSWIMLVHGVRINFTSNFAFENGGALHYVSPPALSVSSTQSCFIYYQPPPENVDSPLQNVSVIFQKNKAIQSGDALFISQRDDCILSNGSRLFDPNRTDLFDYSGQNPSLTKSIIATSPKVLKLKGGCALKPTTKSEFGVYSTMPGLPLSLTVIAVDDFEQPVSTSLSLNTHNVLNYNNELFTSDVCSTNDSCDISQRMIISGVPVDDLRIMAPEKFKDFLLMFETGDLVSVFLPLQINFTECGLGFYYNDSTSSCKCHDTALKSSPLLCFKDTNTNLETPCARSNYWLGNLPVDNDTNVTVFHMCHMGKCYSAVDSHLSPCFDYSGYYILYNGTQVCKNNLSGPLCSSCDGHDGVLSYNSYGCYPCSTGKKIVLLLLMALECVVIVTIIVAFLKLNLHISTAGFYSFLYFYSVLPLFFWFNLPDSLEVVITIVVDFTSLDFDILKYLQLCLFDNVRPIHYEVLHFVYPIMVISLIFALIKLDQYCLRRCSFFSGDSSIQALCIILLISYTSISETALNILLPLYYENVNNTDVTVIGWYVFVDPGLKYFDLQHHLPFWIVAALVELLLVLPFALGMLFAPWLMRRFNFARIWPILDEYQACFRDDCRWFPGVYLVARQVLVLISLLVGVPEAVTYMQQIFCLLLAVLVSTLQPYRQRWINYLDTFFLVLLSLISFSANNPTALQVFSGVPTLRIAIISILSLAPVAVMLLAITGMLCWLLWQRYVKFKTANQVLTVAADLYYDHQDPLSTDCPPNNEDNSDALTSSNNFDDAPPRFYEQERKEHTGGEESSEDDNDDGVDEEASLLGKQRQSGFLGVWRRMVPTGSRSSAPRSNSTVKSAGLSSFHTWHTD